MREFGQEGVIFGFLSGGPGVEGIFPVWGAGKPVEFFEELLALEALIDSPAGGGEGQQAKKDYKRFNSSCFLASNSASVRMPASLSWASSFRV